MVNMPEISQGQEFPTLQDFKKALSQWAIEENFTPAILDSDNLRVRAGCRSAPDCTFRIRCNYSKKKGRAKVSTCDDVHTCALEPLVNQEIKRPEASKLRFLLEAVPKHMNVDANTPTKAIVDIVKQHYGQNIALRQAQKVKAHLCPRQRTCRYCGGPTHGGVRCPQKPAAHVDAPSNPPSTAMQGDASMELDFGEDPFHDLSELEVNNNASPTHDVDTIVSVTQSQVLRSTTLEPTFDDIGMSQPVSSAIDPAIDPNLIAESLGTFMRPHIRPVRTLNPLLSSTTISTQQFSGPSARQQIPRTAQETQMEAARLMQQASQLMQEAARLQAEAAHLMTSVTGS